MGLLPENRKFSIRKFHRNPAVYSTKVYFGRNGFSYYQTLVETICLLMLWTLFFTDRFLTKDVDAKIRYFNEYSVKPYYRIAPYLVGIACADIYMKTKDCVSNMKENWWKVWRKCIMIFTAQTEPNETPHQMINGIEFCRYLKNCSLPKICGSSN